MMLSHSFLCSRTFLFLDVGHDAALEAEKGGRETQGDGLQLCEIDSAFCRHVVAPHAALL